MSDPSKQVPLYWYALGYHWANKQYNGMATAFVGFPDQNLTKQRIWDAKKVAHADCPPNQMLFLRGTYLGFMTQEQMDGPDERAKVSESGEEPAQGGGVSR